SRLRPQHVPTPSQDTDHAPLVDDVDALDARLEQRQLGAVDAEDRRDQQVRPRNREDGLDDLGLAAGLVNHVGSAPAAHVDVVAADAQRPGVALGLDDEYAGGPDDDVVDVRARPGLAAVVEDDEALGLELGQGAGGPILAVRPGAP